MTESGLPLDNNNCIVSRTEPCQLPGEVRLLLSGEGRMPGTTAEAPTQAVEEVVAC